MRLWQAYTVKGLGFAWRIFGMIVGPQWSTWTFRSDDDRLAAVTFFSAVQVISVILALIGLESHQIWLKFVGCMGFFSCGVVTALVSLGIFITNFSRDASQKADEVIAASKEPARAEAGQLSQVPQDWIAASACYQQRKDSN